MAEIIFEELDAEPTPPPTLSGGGTLPLTGFGFGDLSALGGVGFAVLDIFQQDSGVLAPPKFGIGDAYFPIEAAYSFMPAVMPPATGEGELRFYGLGYEASSYGRGVLDIFGTGSQPQDLDIGLLPYVELFEWPFFGDAAVGQGTSGVTSELLASNLLTAIHNQQAVGAETLSLRDRLRLLLEAVVTDSAAFASAVAGDPLVTAAIVDSLQLAGAAQSSVAAMALLADMLAFAEAMASVQEGEVTDAAELADTIEALARALEVVVSTAAFSETLQGLAVLTVLVPDALELGDELTGQALYTVLLREGMSLAVSFQLDGIPYTGLAMNMANRGITEYDNFDFNSLAWFNGKLYGAGAAGLYRHDGSTDDGAPIDAFLRTAMQRLSGGKATRMADAYLGFRANGELQLKVTVSERLDGEQVKIGYVYDLVAAPRGAPQPGRFKLGRGMKTVYGAFTLSNVAGSDFAIDVLEIYPLALDRRLP